MNVGARVLKRISSNLVLTNKLTNDSAANPPPPVLPPLLSDQAKQLSEERRAASSKSLQVANELRSVFPLAVMNQFNQCYPIRCRNGCSVDIYAGSGHFFCSRCNQVRELVDIPRIVCQEDGEASVSKEQCFPYPENSLPAEEYFVHSFPDSPPGKFDRSRFKSVSKTLQFHKASKILAETLTEFDCYFNSETGTLYFPCSNGSADICGHEEVTCTGKLPGKPDIASDHSKVIFKPSSDVDDDCLVITSGILNACAIYQSSSVSTLCIENQPDLKFSLSFVPRLAGYSRIIFFLPDMCKNYQLVHSISRILGQDRCFFISAQMGCKYKSPLEALKALRSAQDFADLLNDYSIPVSSLTSSFEQLLSDAEAFLRDPQASLGFQFHRFSPLNGLLGGLRLGEMTVVSGDTGMGKTTFATELALDVCLHNYLPTAFVSLEMQPKITLLKMGRQLLLQEVTLNNFSYFREAITNVPMFISNCSGYIGLTEILLEFEKMCMQFGVRHFVIDHLQYLQGVEMLDNKVLSSSEELVSVNRVLRKLKQFVTSYNVHMTILAQPRKQYSQSNSNGGHSDRILSNHEIAGTVSLTQIPDNILILQSKTLSDTSSGSGSNTRMSKYIQVTKNRFKGTLGVMPLMYSARSGTFSVAAATHVSGAATESSVSS